MIHMKCPLVRFTVGRFGTGVDDAAGGASAPLSIGGGVMTSPGVGAADCAAAAARVGAAVGPGVAPGAMSEHNNMRSCN